MLIDIRTGQTCQRMPVWVWMRFIADDRFLTRFTERVRYNPCIYLDDNDVGREAGHYHLYFVDGDGDCLMQVVSRYLVADKDYQIRMEILTLEEVKQWVDIEVFMESAVYRMTKGKYRTNQQPECEVRSSHSLSTRPSP